MYVQIWSTKIEEKVQWMRFIATRMFMPDVEDATNTKDKVCNNLKRMLQVWQGKELKVEGKAGNKKGVAGSSKHLSAKEIGRIQMAERTEVKKTYEQWWQNALEQPVDETLWSVRILDKIDKVYVDKIQKTGAMEHYGHQNGKWKSAMAEYNATVRMLLKEEWAAVSAVAEELRREEEEDAAKTADETAKKDGASGSGEQREEGEEGEAEAEGEEGEAQEGSAEQQGLSDASEMSTEGVVFEAENKLRWLELVHECDQSFNIPWPTISFQRDFIKQLERYTLGVQWVSRWILSCVYCLYITD